MSQGMLACGAAGLVTWNLGENLDIQAVCTVCDADMWIIFNVLYTFVKSTAFFVCLQGATVVSAFRHPLMHHA